MATEASFVATEKVQSIVSQALQTPLVSWRADHLLDKALASVKHKKSKSQREQHLLELEALSEVSTMAY